jgi:hypothetical protein
MIPKEKAKELVKIMSIGQKFIDNPEPGESYFVPKNEYAKECALKVVDEIFEFMNMYDEYIGTVSNANSKWVKYYHKVKQEIEKL